jgi:hypothetical protein
MREQKMSEIKKMIERGELSIDALKWKVRKEGGLTPSQIGSTAYSSLKPGSTQSKFFTTMKCS